eukprot:11052832-Lingulodinium_polyedra.AAC.1
MANMTRTTSCQKGERALRSSHYQHGLLNINMRHDFHQPVAKTPAATCNSTEEDARVTGEVGGYLLLLKDVANTTE